MLIDAVMQSHELSTILSLHLLVLNVFDVSCVVTIPLALMEDLEAPLAYAVDHGAAIGKKLNISDL